mgnify:CR=1 FL=1
MINEIKNTGSTWSRILNIKILNTLQEVIDYSILISQKDNIILFSPGGNSFDLFESYIHRGNEFKKFLDPFEGRS